MCSREDNQEVGLEAATLERVRNSSLVERDCADNGTGLSQTPKPGISIANGRGAFLLRRRRSGKDCWSGKKCECWHE